MKPKIVRTTTLALILGAIAARAATAFAQTDSPSGVRANLSSREAYVGVPITLQIEVANAASHDRPELPAIDGASVESLGTPSRSSQTTIINGRRTDRTSVTYAWRITPRRPGRFVVPAVNVTVNGQIVRTRPLAFVATKSETGDLLFADVVADRDAIYVGEALPVTLRIWVKPYRDAEHGVTLSEDDMWQLVSEDPTALGPFGERLVELSQDHRRPAGKEVLRKDTEGNEHSYYLYEIETTFYPTRPGAVAMGDVQVVVAYPTGLGRARDLFSMFERRLTVTGTRPIVADGTIPKIDVKPVPQIGRPDDYRGAVGRYEILTHASPTHVKAGDPITLLIGIHGDGPMDLVQAPPLSSFPELTGDFRVPTDPPAGIVENGVKTFSVSLRPKRAGIETIPGIPLSYFDPEQEAFVTVRSDPISIEVDEADTLELATVAGNGPSDDERGSGSSGSAVTFANTSDLSVLRTQSTPALWPFVIILAAGPLTFVGTWLVRRLVWSETGWTGPRLRRPEVTARRAIEAARDPRELSGALLGFVAAQIDAAAGSLTRPEAMEGLRKQGIRDGLNLLDGVLDQCERLAYAPSGAANMTQLKEAGLNCLAAITGSRSTLPRAHGVDKIAIPPVRSVDFNPHERARGLKSTLR